VAICSTPSLQGVHPFSKPTADVTDSAQLNMALPKSGKGCSKEQKSIGEMSSKITSGLSSILEFRLSDESNHEIIDGGYDLSHVAHRHMRSIFFEGHIAATMESSFDASMGSTHIQNAQRCGMDSIQAGDSKFCFTGSVIATTRAEPLEVSFEPIDLS
jgi:hypothetical protein